MAPFGRLAPIATRAFAPVERAIEEKRIPGAALGLATPDGDRAELWAGRAVLDPPEPLERTTWFDLASLTKVMVTTIEILRLVEDGLADLDDPVSRHLPDLAATDPDAPTRRFTLRALLSHQTGLVPVVPIHRWGEGADRLKSLILAHDWSIGEPAYSDINFILLGLVIERLRNRPLAETALAPGLSFAPEPAETAATEQCEWRGRLVRGDVHDENAYALGGAAGHAGLFGTIDGVLDFAQSLMTGQILGPAALAEMRRTQTPTRALGWERPFPLWTGGSLCSAATIGHTGFTGTGLWLDFDRGVAWTLLTNRVHPTRHRNTGIQDLRRTVSNIVSGSWAGTGTGTPSAPAGATRPA